MKMIIGLIIGIGLGVWISDTNPELAEKVRVASDVSVSAAQSALDRIQDN